MSNIEIHGYSLKQEKIVADLEREIFALFRGEPYINEIVVTIFHGQVHNHRGHSQPFLRFLSSCETHRKEMIQKLRTLSIDLEVMPVLENFFEAPEPPA
jgi:hypothetical protein